jgi:hypothetical protein
MVISSLLQQVLASDVLSSAVRGCLNEMPNRSLDGERQPSVGWASRT